jgi:Cu2+-exporting ATPase
MQGRALDGSIWRLGKGPAPHVAANDAGDAETWLSCAGSPVACFRFAETLRADAVAAVRALESDGVRVALISGDAPSRVERIGRLLGIKDRRGGMTPQDKLAAVREAQARGERVAMLGDGVNDAPVLAQADTSLAMGEGAQIARAQADGVLVSNALQDVVRARALAKKTLSVVRQNFAWAAVYNAACVPLALIGWLPPWAAGLGMATSSFVVVLNSLRLAR